MIYVMKKLIYRLFGYTNIISPHYPNYNNMSAYLPCYNKKLCRTTVNDIDIPNKELCHEHNVDFTCACLTALSITSSRSSIGYIVGTTESGISHFRFFPFEIGAFQTGHPLNGVTYIADVNMPEENVINLLLSLDCSEATAMLDAVFRVPVIVKTFTYMLLHMRKHDITPIQNGINALHATCPLHETLHAIYKHYEIKDVCADIHRMIADYVVDFSHWETDIWHSIRKHGAIYDKRKYLIAFCKPFPENPYPNVPLCVRLDYLTTNDYVKTTYLCSKKNRCFEFNELQYVGYATLDECSQIGEILIDAQTNNDNVDYNTVKSEIIELVSERYLFSRSPGNYLSFMAFPNQNVDPDNVLTLHDVIINMIGQDSVARNLLRDNNMSVTDVDEFLDGIIHRYIPSSKKSARK